MTDRGMRPALLLVPTLALALATVAAPRPAHACDKMVETPFDLHDRAATVAVVRVTAVPAPRGRHKVQIGRVTLAVERMIRGGRATTLTSRLTGSSCDAGFRRGKRALVFLDAGGDVVGAYDGYQEIADDTWPELLRRWGASAAPTERAAILAEVITTGRGEPTRDAAWTLTDSPDLLAALDSTQIAALVDATRRTHVDSMLPVALARLHATGLAAAMGRRTFTFGADARELAKHARFEAIDDAAVLADQLAAATGAEAAAAFDRCERLHRRKLAASFFDYMSGFDPAVTTGFVTACRIGTPMP